MEDLIYWTGVATLLSVGLLITLLSIYLVTCKLRNMLVNKLKSSYNHVQLYYFMAQLKEKGYAQAVDEIDNN